MLFIHDAGVASSPVKSPLLQGRGAVTRAEPAFQNKHPRIIVAPQYPVVIVALLLKKLNLFAGALLVAGKEPKILAPLT